MFHNIYVQHELKHRILHLPPSLPALELFLLPPGYITQRMLKPLHEFSFSLRIFCFKANHAFIPTEKATSGSEISSQT